MTTSITIRPDRPADRGALERLAALDSRRLPDGDLLLGEVDGTLLAAIGIHGGQAIADPFAPTADLVAMLRMYARRLPSDTGGRRRGPATFGLRSRPA